MGDGPRSGCRPVAEVLDRELRYKLLVSTGSYSLFRLAERRPEEDDLRLRGARDHAPVCATRSRCGRVLGAEQTAPLRHAQRGRELLRSRSALGRRRALLEHRLDAVEDPLQAELEAVRGCGGGLEDLDERRVLRGTRVCAQEGGVRRPPVRGADAAVGGQDGELEPPCCGRNDRIRTMRHSHCAHLAPPPWPTPPRCTTPCLARIARAPRGPAPLGFSAELAVTCDALARSPW